MRVLSLFSGIGGFDIGLERAGMRTVAFCEFDPYCQAVLKRHWPEVPIYDDVRSLSADTLRRDGVWPIDVIAGGFPCQDLSYAGKRAGIEGERSGLWSEFARLIGEVRPWFALMENVPGLLSAGHGRVLGDLAALGYDAVWDCVPASALGAPHRRDRVWIIAHTQHPHADLAGLHRAAQHVVGDAEPGNEQVSEPRQVREILADAASGGCQGVHDGHAEPIDVAARSGAVCNASIAGLSDRIRGSLERSGTQPELERPDWRQPEPRLGRVADGVSHWVDASGWLEEPEGVPRVATGIENRASRLKALGNSIVPQVAFLIGQAVMESTK